MSGYSYEKQNFQDRQLLTHEHLNHIEDGIFVVSQQVEALGSILDGKKINFLGDSYVAGHTAGSKITWNYMLAQKHNMTWRNYGINGNGIVANRGSTPMIERYTQMDNDADYVVVVGGKNDYNAQLDLNSFKDGVANLISGLVTKYPGKKICFFTPWYVPQSILEANNNGGAIPLIDYVNAIEEVCKTYSIPCFNSNRSGVLMWDATFRTNYCLSPTDISHLNEAGHRLFLNAAEKFIESI
jgi:lysophospholipase L1-like esterase